MANETAERIERALRAYNEDGVEAMLPFIHPEFEMTTTAEVAAEPDTYRGHDGVRRYFGSFLEIMDEVRVEPTEIEARGDGGLVRFNLVARGKATGIEAVQKGFGDLRPRGRPRSPDQVLLRMRRRPLRRFGD